MSDRITDADGQPLLYVNLRLDENTDSVVVVGRVPCSEGKYLAASPESPAAAVYARRTDSGEAFSDISASPIDLSPFAGQTVSFDFKVHANDVAGFTRVALPVRVTFNP